MYHELQTLYNHLFKGVSLRETRHNVSQKLNVSQNCLQWGRSPLGDDLKSSPEHKNDTT